MPAHVRSEAGVEPSPRGLDNMRLSKVGRPLCSPVPSDYVEATRGRGDRTAVQRVLMLYSTLPANGDSRAQVLGKVNNSCPRASELVRH